ncbi:MAG: transcription-repair coupling factor [Magnetococcales bacterium]|nr:transcription-repair coupling factor [Magnetococcales bacterium]NGZ05022.1 transcription-repair coupling factor [Magnetococcales bacterium]
MKHPLLTPLAPLLERRGPPYPQLGNLPGAALSWLAVETTRHVKGPIVVITGTSSRAESLYREMLFFAEHIQSAISLLPFPAWETLPFERLSPYGPIMGERIRALFRLTQTLGTGPITAGDSAGHSLTTLITTPSALMRRTVPHRYLATHGLSVTKGDQLNIAALRLFLTSAGYRAVTQVEESGEYAIRGGIVDFFPPGREDPVRLELFGDEVETLRLFDPITQRSTDRISSVQALPVSEVILTDETIRDFRATFRQTYGIGASEDELYKQVSKGEKSQGMEQYLPFFYSPADTFFDYLPPGTLFLLDADALAEAKRFDDEIQERLNNLEQESQRDPSRSPPPRSLYLSEQDFLERLNAYAVFATTSRAAPGGISLGFDPAPNFIQLAQQQPADPPFSPLDLASDTIRQSQSQGFKVCITAASMGQRERLRELLEDHKIPTATIAHWNELLTIPPGITTYLAVGDLDMGFIHGRMGVMLLTDSAIFGIKTKRRKTDPRYLDQLLAGFTDLKEQDPVVHADHGVGRYGGLHSLEVGGIKNDFLLIHYAGSDKLYAPVENLDRVTKYVGGDDVPLDKLGGIKWEKTKEKAKRKILEMAEELVHLQALRQGNHGFSFSTPDPLLQEFAAGFPFEETPDQTAAIECVLADMAATRPMDRLVCGDVGFGKTEVALRAAFRAVMDGKQVAILSPTTILTQQHYETFTRRLANYPISVDILSRFRTPAEQKKTVEMIQHGGVDIIVGTHRLLQKDVVFKDLGLLVVDEEQRFGVVHKERIKQMRATVDILTLTATPIPRTLHMAMSGLRDISIIATPPINRLAIRTFVIQFDRQKVREAILREIYRGGQVFFVHNHVQDIDKMAADLSELVPEAKIGVAHGQMREGRLEKIMLSFYRQEFNLLLCTTIIENGVDIPTANTIIIHRADHFGLAQLHQLRGRVGRSKHRAYAYLLIPHPQSLTEDALRRLEAIESMGELGAGFTLATHDMEIRGAGNILGDEQSGQMREVGFELYNQMLKEAVEKLAAGNDLTQQTAKPATEEFSPVINLHISTHIPEEYVPDVRQRLTLYKRIATLENGNDISEMRAELTDRFGLLPESTHNLLRVMILKQACRRIRIVKIDAGPKGATLQFHTTPNVNPEGFIQLLQQSQGTIRLNQETQTLSIKDRLWEDPARRIEELHAILKQL